MLRVALLLCLTAPPALACETALLLSIDVSGSIDRADYRLQTGGLAAALSDPGVVEALVRDQVALAVVQWSGVAEQALVLTWARMLTEAVTASIAINAIAIEEPGAAIPITTYYRRWIASPDGFVVTVRGLQDYAETLRLKLLRELADPVG